MYSYINTEYCKVDTFFVSGNYLIRYKPGDSFIEVFRNEEKWIIENLEILKQDFYIKVNGNYLAINNEQRTESVIYNLEDGSNIFCDDCFLNFYKPNSLLKNCYVGFLAEKEFCIYGLETKRKTIFQELIEGYFGFLSNDRALLYLNKNSTLFCCDLQFKEHWSLDVTDIGYFQDDIFGRRPGKVAAVEVWNNQLIVLTGKKVLWLEMETGQLLSELETGQRNNWIILEDDIAYVNYLRINLQTRQIEESLYMKGGILYKDTPTEKYTIRVEYFVKPTLHDDKLWAIANNSYGRYAVAIDKLTGEYVWYYLLDTDGNLSAPKFHSNKMYV